MATLKINTTDKTKVMEIEMAFETRNKETWNLAPEKFSKSCKNIDEVLTHLRFEELYGYCASWSDFSIS